MQNKENNNSDFVAKEWPALSVVKFVCVAMMIFVHAHLALITDSYVIADTSGFFYKVTSDFMFVGLFLFTLPIISGAILRMDFGVNIINEKLKDYSFKKVLMTAIFLILAGFFMNAITWSAWYIFSWNVLQLIALSFIVIAVLVKFFSTRAVLLLGMITLIAAEPLRNFLGNMDHSYFGGILVGANNAYVFWPFFPWFSVVAFGFLFAHYFLKYKDSFNFRISAIGIGILFLAIAIFRGEISPYLDPKYIWGPSIFQPKIGLVLAAMGLFCVLVVGANFLFRDIKLRKYGIVNCYSKGILWIYVIQMFASYKLSFLVKSFFPMDKPSLVYFILPVVMLLLSWLVGALSIKLLQEKLIVVRLKKIQ